MAMPSWVAMEPTRSGLTSTGRRALRPRCRSIPLRFLLRCPRPEPRPETLGGRRKAESVCLKTR
eukprot:15449531-Alexandrium_andersonii.AAC.1